MVAVLLAALATGLATPVGALPVLLLPPLSRRTYDGLLGFGAGLMLAAATLGLLGAALEGIRAGGVLDVTRLVLVLSGLLSGVAILFFMDRLIPHEHAGGHHVHVHDDHVHDHDHRACGPGEDPAPVDEPLAPVDGPLHAAAEAVGGDVITARKQGLLVVGVMSLHRLPEGLAIGAAYASGGSHGLGLTLAAAIAVQNAVEGSVMAAPLRRGGLGVSALLLLVTATSIVVPVGAVAGYLLSSRIESALPFMLALAAGALLYLTCNEVIPESHSHGHEVRATFGIIGGFVLIILMQALLGHEG